MKIKILFILSLLFNVLFILFLILSSQSKKSFLSYNKKDGYFTSAAVVSVPLSEEISFGTIEITLMPMEKAYLQYSVCTPEITQGNMIIRALYDPDIISVKDSGYGIEILALAHGSTLMQTLTNDGIKDIALITVK